MIILDKLRLPVIKIYYLKIILFSVVLLWALVCSTLLILNRPKIILISINDQGARVISNDNSQSLKHEKLSFLKRFLFLSYNYDSINYHSKISAAGDLMSNTLWKDKEKEYKSIFNKLKNTNLNQTAQVDDIREIDNESYDAYLSIKITTRLNEVNIKYKISLKINKHTRTIDNPFAWEVINYNEEQKS